MAQTLIEEAQKTREYGRREALYCDTVAERARLVRNLLFLYTAQRKVPRDKIEFLKTALRHCYEEVKDLDRFKVSRGVLGPLQARVKDALDIHAVKTSMLQVQDLREMLEV